MSDNMMSVDRARRLTDGGRHTTHAEWVMPAARTIAYLAEQNERLRNALEHFGYDKEARQEGLILPGDMESPE